MIFIFPDLVRDAVEQFPNLPIIRVGMRHPDGCDIGGQAAVTRSSLSLWRRTTMVFFSVADLEFIALRMEADLPWRRFLTSVVFGNQLFDCFKDDSELFVIFFLQRLDLSCELAIRIHEPAQLHEGAHDGDVDLDRALGAKNARKHRHALLGKSVRVISSAAMFA